MNLCPNETVASSTGPNSSILWNLPTASPAVAMPVFENNPNEKRTVECREKDKKLEKIIGMFDDGHAKNSVLFLLTLQYTSIQILLWLEFKILVMIKKKPTIAIIYDFDGTIYDGDSGVDLILFSIKKKPSLIFHYIGCIGVVIQYLLKLKKKEEMKNKLFAITIAFTQQKQ